MLSPLSNEMGTPVDWWLSYKLPDDVGPKKDSTGFEFLYADANNSTFAMSALTLDHGKGTIALTLAQLFDTKDEDTGYILWNDEIPPTKEEPKPKDNGTKGHTKGILGFNKKTNSGFYLLHSTPRFPAVGEIELPDMEKGYGQTYLCISIDYATVNSIAEVLRLNHEPQVYASKLPGISDDESIAKLAKMDSDPYPASPAMIHIKTRGGKPFIFFGKNRKWSMAPKGETGKDFWADHVGPNLKCDLNVETWRRGLVFTDIDSDGVDDTLDVLNIDLSPLGKEFKGYKWPYTKDHAKWGISTLNPPGWTIIADINRQTSQAKRGGGGLAFQEANIWRAMKSIEIPEKDIHEGDVKEVANK